MKELLLSYAQFNAWANGLLLDVIATLTTEQQEQAIVSSFPTVRSMVLHLLDANSIWWQRIQLQEKILRPSQNFEGDFTAVYAALRKVDGQWVEYVQKANDHLFTHEFQYFDLKKQPQKSMVQDVLVHLFNHGTYHRGQLVMMLRQLGVEKIPSTDYIAWTRLRK